MENLKQTLIENIADILDGNDVQLEGILNDLHDPIKREDSELHIRMAEAALSEYKRTCEGENKPKSEQLEHDALLGVVNSYEIDFNGHCKCRIEIANNEPKVTDAMNGWGEIIPASTAIVTKS